MTNNSQKLVAIYVRVSTQDQSCEIQRKELTEYCRDRNFKVFKIYEDKATGTNGNRPALKQLLIDVRARKVDCVLVWKLDRLFRSLKDLILTLQEFTELDIAFISLRDQLDLTTSAGKLMLHIIGAFAEFEASIIRERVRAGVANAKLKGVKFGRKPVINISLAINLRDAGWSLARIAKHLKVSKAGVHKVLSKTSDTKSSTKSKKMEKL